MKFFKKIKPFHTDERGEMAYLIEGAAIQSVLRITCKKGSIRANHVHTKDSHYSYMLEGSMEYYFREGMNAKNPIKHIKVEKGEMVYTPPLEAHAMKFLEDSVFLALATEKRNKNKYEDDLKRVELIN
ncbi:MAG: cupin domain-containing protein [Candidatus Levybacteria bacterium]|nr:cupin domain-containing protein [Candidatus Levybacteria bacterium]